MAESEEELKSLFFFKFYFIFKLYITVLVLPNIKMNPKVKEESEKVGFKLNVQKTKIMASGPITSWEIDGETVEIVSDFIFGGYKITADGDCSQEIK